MTLDELLTLSSVRIALVLYVFALLLRIGRYRCQSRLAWTIGCIAFLLHVVAAFHFVHHWSPDSAYAETARQTAEVIGLHWGGGIYFNYLFAVVWAGDVIWWWVKPSGYLSRPRSMEWGIQGFLALIAFNATVVFGHGAIRWAGVGATVLILVTWVAVGFSRRDAG